MTILHVIDHSGLGGAQTVLRGILSHPDRADSHYGVGLRTNGDSSIPSPRFFEANTSSRFSMAPLFHVARLYREIHADVLHAHLKRSVLFCVLLRVLVLPKAKLVVHVHGSPVDDKSYSLILKLCSRWIDGLLCVSHEIRRQLMSVVRFRGHVVVQVAHNPITTEHLVVSNDPAEVKRKHGIPDNAFVVGFLGRITKIKGWQDIIDLANLYDGRVGGDSEVIFVLAGYGEDAGFLTSLEHELTNVRYIGRVDNVGSFINAIDCVIVPSHREAMGLVQLEAQYLETPVVCYDIPGLNETLTNEHDALLVPPRDVHALRHAVERVRSNHALREKLIRNGKIDAQRFALEPYLSKVSDFYNGVVDAK